MQNNKKMDLSNEEKRDLVIQYVVQIGPLIFLGKDFKFFSNYEFSFEENILFFKNKQDIMNVVHKIPCKFFFITEIYNTGYNEKSVIKSIEEVQNKPWYRFW